MEPDGWLGVEIRHLAALRALASEGSFGRAAEHLGYTQSAVSQQIAMLERIVGERLVERPGGPRPISLTTAGELVLGHAESIVARLKAAQADVRALRAGEAGTLHVGVFQSAGARLLPEIMRSFSDRRPLVEVMLDEHDEEVAAAVERGELDVGFVLLPVGDAPLETIELVRDPYVLVVPADSPLAGRPAPPFRDLAGLPLVGFRDGSSQLPIEAAFRAEGVEPRWAFRSNDNQTVQGLVAAGIGMSIQPLLTVDEADPQTALIDVSGSVAPRIIALARHRDRYHSPAARAFVDSALAATATRR